MSKENIALVGLPVVNIKSYIEASAQTKFRIERMMSKSGYYENNPSISDYDSINIQYKKIWLPEQKANKFAREEIWEADLEWIIENGYYELFLLYILNTLEKNTERGQRIIKTYVTYFVNLFSNLECQTIQEKEREKILKRSKENGKDVVEKYKNNGKGYHTWETYALEQLGYLFSDLLRIIFCEIDLEYERNKELYYNVIETFKYLPTTENFFLERCVADIRDPRVFLNDKYGDELKEAAWQRISFYEAIEDLSEEEKTAFEFLRNTQIFIQPVRCDCPKINELKYRIALNCCFFELTPTEEENGKEYTGKKWGIYDYSVEMPYVLFKSADKQPVLAYYTLLALKEGKIRIKSEQYAGEVVEKITPIIPTTKADGLRRVLSKQKAE